jgi:hypothetical protein
MARLSAEEVRHVRIGEIEKEDDQILFLFAVLVIAPKRKGPFRVHSVASRAANL